MVSTISQAHGLISRMSGCRSGRLHVGAINRKNGVRPVGRTPLFCLLTDYSKLREMGKSLVGVLIKIFAFEDLYNFNE